MLMYSLVMIMGLNISFWWWVWLMLELMNWLLMMYINQVSFMMSFMIWQSLSSLGLMLNFILINNFFFLVMFLLFKMGLPPFHFWFWSFSKSWNWKSLILFMFMHKYIPMLLTLNFMLNIYWKWILLSPFLGLLMFFIVFSIKNLIFSMSMSDSAWLLMSGIISMKIMFIYFIINMMMMYILLKLFCNENFKLKINMLNFMMFLLLYFGLPPFITFLLKYFILAMIKFLFSIILLLGVLFNLIILWSWLYMISMNLKTNSLNYSMYYFIILMNVMWLINY